MCSPSRFTKALGSFIFLNNLILLKNKSEVTAGVQESVGLHFFKFVMFPKII